MILLAWPVIFSALCAIVLFAILWIEISDSTPFLKRLRFISKLLWLVSILYVVVVIAQITHNYISAVIGYLGSLLLLIVLIYNIAVKREKIIIGVMEFGGWIILGAWMIYVSLLLNNMIASSPMWIGVLTGSGFIFSAIEHWSISESKIIERLREGRSGYGVFMTYAIFSLWLAYIITQV